MRVASLVVLSPPTPFSRGKGIHCLFRLSPKSCRTLNVVPRLGLWRFPANWCPTSHAYQYPCLQLVALKRLTIEAKPFA